MVKLIVSDIDGTLVPDGSGEGAINEEYFRQIERLYDKGVRFVACSGRQFMSMYRLLSPVAHLIYFICEGGGFICDGDRKVLYKQVLSPETVSELIHDAKMIRQMDVMVAGIKRSYCRSRDSELYRWLADGYGFDVEAVGDLEAGIDDEITKVSLYHKDAAEELTKDVFRPKWEKRVKTILAGKQWLDCVSLSSGKGNGVAFLQEYLNATKEETIVFGDNQNDIEMFDYAGTSYAVKNARDEVKTAADVICGEMRDDGVLQVLKSL
ncbi:MAG: HAD family hydrolase [Eubacterium sp.]|nr:HAD family hydrolase [Eubacterium sp.]